MTASIPPKPYEAPLAIPPGFTIREMLEDLGMSQKDLAIRMGRPPQAINEILQGKKTITAETAAQLEVVLGMTQKYWLNREANYQAARERLEQEKSILQDIERLHAFPYSDLQQRGLVAEASGRSAQGKRERVINLRRFLRVANFAALDRYLGQFKLAARLAHTSALSKEKLAVWLRIGEKQAEDEQWPVMSFRKRALEEALPRLRELSRVRDAETVMTTLREIGEETGVVFLFVKEFRNFPTKGMTVWMNNRPYIMLTLHGKRWDMLWFTLFHEIAHVLLHERKVFIEGSSIPANGPEEDEANRFASDHLINPESYREFIHQEITTERLESFAHSEAIDASIVVGRLMHDKILRNDDVRFQRLLRSVRWLEQ